MSETLFEKQFNEFIRKIPGAEVIADLDLKIPEGVKIADYFFENRRMVAELKCLEEDTGERIQELVNEMLERGEIIFYGQLPFDQVISKLSAEQQDQLNKQAFDSVTSSIEDAFEKANRQIRDTKNVFNLKDAVGFVILLNNGNITLDPKIAVYKLQYLMNKKRAEQVRYESLNFGLYISVRHYNVMKQEKIFPIITFINDNLRKLNEEEGAFVIDFQKCYSTYKKMPIYLPENLKITDAINFPFKTE